MKKRILLCGGGSGGHVIPNLAVAHYLKDSADLFYLGSCQLDKKLVSQADYIQYFEYNPPKFRRSLSVKNLTLPFAYVRAYKQAKAVLQQIKPNLVFTKGGYAGLPVAFAAKKLKIKVFGHESDASLGLAHKIFLHHYEKLFSAFPLSEKIECVGALIRPQIYLGNRQEGLKITGFDGAKPILAVFGGSLGSQQLNRLIYSARKKLTEKFDIFVICGRGKIFAQSEKSFHLTEFAPNIEHIYACAFACIMRGGANSLCECVACHLPFAALPLLASSRKEQLQNIRRFEQKNCGYLLDGSVENLYWTLEKICANHTQHVNCCKCVDIDATEKVAQHLLNIK